MKTYYPANSFSLMSGQGDTLRDAFKRMAWKNYQRAKEEWLSIKANVTRFTISSWKLGVDVVAPIRWSNIWLRKQKAKANLRELD
jgi:hypothetical protein